MLTDCKYVAVRDYLLKLIHSAGGDDGGKLPSESELSARFSVSRGTVQKAVNELLNDGLLYRQRGSGTFIAPEAGKRREPLIGLVMPHMENRDNTHWQIMNAAERVLREAGYGVVSCTEPSEQETGFLLAHVAGFLFSPHEGENSPARNDEFAREVLQRRLPMVLVDKTWEGDLGAMFPCVGSSNEQAAHDLIALLLKRGIRRIAILCTPAAAGIARCAGYRRAFAEAGIAVPEEYVWCCEEPLLRDVGARATRLLTALASPPEVIFCVNDAIACNTIRRLREYGVHVPEEMGVVGFDNNHYSEIIDPPLTTVSQNCAQIGETAARLLLAKLADPTAAADSVNVDCEIVIRDSVSFPMEKDKTA